LGLVADLSWVTDIGVGVGVFLIGIAAFVGALALAKTLGRINATLDEVDRQLAGLGKPVGDAIAQVGGIADTADQTLEHLTGVVRSLEDVAGSVSKTASLAKDALSPAIVNVGATITGVSAGLRRLVTGRNSRNGDVEE
jgi:ABC-type transporter Mla subunit MlaD